LEPSGTGIRQDDSAMTVPTKTNPFTPRPDEAERRKRLTRMKRVATGLLAFSGGVFVVTAWLEARYPWLGYVRAMAEASLVGGLADWFAVTALFRHPLGLPIPHTAIVAKQKERIGRILGTFVQNHFLSRDVIATRLLAMRPSERGARWLREPENARKLARQASAGIMRTLDAMPDDRMRAFVHETLTTNLRRTAAAPVLGKTLAVVVAGNRHQELVRRAVELAAQAVQDNHDLIRDKVRKESPWWVPGAVDERIYRKIISAVENLLREIAARPDHPVRASLDKTIAEFIEQLQTSPEMIARTEELKNQWLDDAMLAELSAKLWDGAKRAILRQAAGDGGEEPGALERGIASFGEALLANEALLAETDEWIVDAAVTVAEQNRQEVADIITQTIAGWDPDATVDRIELAVGRDLQFVRINGTLVGGFVGLAIYTIYRALH
jgi:uncharacterized membrane-anchored protein YjiN (DUF445 family)